MEDKQLRKIADELSKLNKNFERLIAELIKGKKELLTEQNDFGPGFGSEGEIKISDK